MKRVLVMAVGLMLTVIAAWCGPPAWGAEPGPDAADLTKGRRLYVKLCQGCHGVEGRGDGYRMLGRDPADLTAPSVKQRPEAALLRTVHEGKPNMPAWRSRLTDDEARDVLAYVRSLPREEAGGAPRR